MGVMNTQSLLANWTSTQLADAIAAAMVAVGWTATDSYTSTDHFRVVSRVFDAGKAKGTAYLQFKVNAAGTATTLALFDSWNATAHTGTNGSQVQTQQASSAPTAACTVIAARSNNDEVTSLIVRQGTTVRSVFCYFRPAVNLSKVTWDEANHHWGFISPGLTVAYFCAGAGANPYGQASQTACIIYPIYYASAGQQMLVNVNGTTGKREILTGATFIYSSQAVIGRLGDDFGSGAVNGLTEGDTLVVTPGVEEWLVVFNNAQYGYPVMRVV